MTRGDISPVFHMGSFVDTLPLFLYAPRNDLRRPGPLDSRPRFSINPIPWRGKMPHHGFSEQDLRQIEERGMTLEVVLEQLERFEKGFSFSDLARPCTIGDGIQVLSGAEIERLAEDFSGTTRTGRVMKFVPASGAASRMFKALLSARNRYEELPSIHSLPEGGKEDPDVTALREFIGRLKSFPFYEQLASAMAADGLDPEALTREGDYKTILDYVLTSKGLNLASIPKGLIPFHRYDGYSRTPFEEHLVEAGAYACDAEKTARVHFTVSPQHESSVRNHLESVRSRHEKSGQRFEIGFSFQHPSTDTIAVDLENRPFRDDAGRLLFRPGGHGALLKNLGELQGDIVFIKNIDNVVPDRLKGDTILYKRALGALLVEVQDTVFKCMEKLQSGGIGDKELDEMFEFARNRLSITPPRDLAAKGKLEKIRFLFDRLNRPLRVCGMVKNEGEPGGGPFWVNHPDGSQSLQIVESSQVDMSSPTQRSVWESSTHFNPVDLVCALRDWKGRPFNLERYRDPETGFISIKSSGGRELKALELPGLWNGAMAFWNTVFVEVPITTFNPVKTIFDLLRKEHQET